MKKLLAFLFLIGFSFHLSAQDIRLKKGVVYLNDKEFLNYKIDVWGIYKAHFFDRETNDEIILIIKNDNETPKYYNDDFTQIKFIGMGVTVETKENKSWKNFIKWLVQSKVIDEHGKINTEKLDLFIQNYDEHMTERTMR
ncbi:MAG: hypothetical protein RIQ62_391 [Bacteroidota bacterium]|jgi:hypothetical protein